MSGNDERRLPGRNGGASSSNNGKSDSSGHLRRRRVLTHVLAEAVEVVSGTGVPRWLLVYRCPCCGQRHVAHGRGEPPDVLERKAACGRGWLAVHPYVSSAVAA